MWARVFFVADTEPRLRIYCCIRRGFSCRGSFRRRARRANPTRWKAAAMGNISELALRFAGINNHHTLALYPVICRDITPGDGNRYQRVFSTRSLADVSSRVHLSAVSTGSLEAQGYGPSSQGNPRDLTHLLEET